jgi:nucleoside-diphosphate-sugar epimerase
MRIGITGGNGNISRYISNRLVAAGHEVVAFNRSGVVPDGVRAVLVDRTDTEAFVEAVQSQKLDVGIDMIVFTAADAEVTVRAFGGVKQLIHCSTGATYGFPLPMPVTEEEPCTATGAYGKNKNEADAYFLRCWSNDRFPVTILKPNITYGFRWANEFPGQMPGSWIRRLVDGKPIVTVGDGDQIHHFLYADDSASGFVGCIGNDKTIGQMFNICATRTYTWRMFYETVMDILGLRVPIVGIPRDALLEMGSHYPQLVERNFWHHMDHSNLKLRRIVPEFHQLRSLDYGLREVLRDFDRKAVEPNKPEIDAMLDDLVDRQLRVAGG